jgi:aminopeptidase N
MTAAKNAITKMEALVGPYPYKTYRLAQTAGGYGMESPGLTWIPTGVAASNVSYLVTHETGHQWFYGIVGNDQAAEPFTDEAATDFLARYVLGSKRASRCSTARLDLSIYKYSSACYYEIVYIQGGNFLDDIRKRMGNTAFWAGLRDYLKANRFELTTTKTLLDTLDDHTSLNLVPRFEPRFPRLY